MPRATGRQEAGGDGRDRTYNAVPGRRDRGGLTSRVVRSLEDHFHLAGANLNSSVGAWDDDGDALAALMEAYNGQEMDDPADRE